MVVKKYKGDWISEGSSEPEEEKNAVRILRPESFIRITWRRMMRITRLKAGEDYLVFDRTHQGSSTMD